MVESYSSKQIKYKTSLTNKGKHISKWTVFYPVLAQKYAHFKFFDDVFFDLPTFGSIT